MNTSGFPATRAISCANVAGRVASCDVVMFTSASTVNGFVENSGGAGAAQELLRGKTVACIGPVTAQAARSAGFEVSVVAEEFTAAGLVEALLRNAQAAPA